MSQQTRRPRLVLADDHEGLLFDLTALLTKQFEVVAVVRDGVSLVEIAGRTKPDVIVTDFRMPGITGIAAGAQVLEEGACRSVVLLTMYADTKLVEEARRAGILGFVLKAKAGQDLIPAIHAVMRGQTYVSSFRSDSGMM